MARSNASNRSRPRFDSRPWNPSPVCSFHHFRVLHTRRLELRGFTSHSRRAGATKLHTRLRSPTDCSEEVASTVIPPEAQPLSSPVSSPTFEWQHFLSRSKNSLVIPRLAHATALASVPDDHAAILFTDSYKISHYKQYPPDMTTLKAYFESRGGAYSETVFFGLQYLIKRHLVGRRVTKEAIDEAADLLSGHFRQDDLFNRAGWEYVEKELGGRLPIRIRAVPEGSVVPNRNALFTVESTDPRVPWLANYVETALMQVWYPITVATSSFMQKRIIKKYMEKTSDSMDTLDFKLCDFGFRGSTSLESGSLGGCAHLTSFKGTDNIEALRVARTYYGPTDLTVGYSCPASERSTMTSWGKDNEVAATRHMMDAFSEGPLSVVADSYDFWRFIDEVIGGKDLVEKVKHRKGKIILRPDSGNPVEVVLEVLNRLDAKFPASNNKNGYKVLPSFIQVIQGDGICAATLEAILAAMAGAGWSAENVTFGSGGALLQRMDRDKLKCAYKCCMAAVNDRQVDVFKDQVTDPGKTSKKGDLTLVKEDGQYKTVRKEEITANMVDQMVTVFENGDLLIDYSFQEVREQIMKSL